MSDTAPKAEPAPTASRREAYATFEEFVASAVRWNEMVAKRQKPEVRSSLSWLRDR